MVLITRSVALRLAFAGLAAFGVVGMLGVLASANAERGPSTGDTPELTLTIRPVREGTPQVVAAVVREEIRGPLTNLVKPFSLRIGIVNTGRRGIADRVDSLVVRDVSGPVPIGVEDDQPNASGYTYYRHWRAQREINTPLTITYRMRPAPRPTGGPQYEFYAHDGGLNAAGMQLFVLPESIPTALIRVKWDLSDLPAGSIAASTYGEGDLELRGRPDTITQPFFLVGPLGRYEPSAPGAAFRAYWLGHPPYEPLREMMWAYRSYDYLRHFYGDTLTTMYRVFIQASGNGGGTGSQNSFMGSAAPGGEDTTRTGPRNMLTHEMGHYFIGGLTGVVPGSDPWFEEGLDTYYTRLVLLRSGLAPVDDYIKDVNDRARAYYTSAYRLLSNDSLTTIGYATGFGAASAQNLAYSRGSLFWSSLDERIRRSSGGRRTLDDLMLPLIRDKQRHPITERAVVDAIGNALGPSGREYFEAIIERGELLVPASGAFGPCFERQPTTYTVQGKAFEGYTWVRVDSVPEPRCRQW